MFAIALMRGVSVRACLASRCVLSKKNKSMKIRTQKIISKHYFLNLYINPNPTLTVKISLIKQSADTLNAILVPVWKSRFVLKSKATDETGLLE